MLTKKLMVSIVLAASFALSTACRTDVMPTVHDDTRKERTVGGHVLNCIETSGHHVYTTELECPLGAEKFTALTLGTHSTFGISLDWEPVSYMRFPVPLPVCPSNGFILDDRDLTDSEIDRIAAAVESAEYQSLYAQRHATYFLYAKLTELLDEGAADHWWYLLQATSEADVCQAPERYREYALATIAAGDERLKQLTRDEDEYWTLSIVIPNMYRRIGDFDEARDWLAQFNDAPAKTDETGELYALGHKLLRQAIVDQRTDRIILEDEDSRDKN